jgi:hypothetical protein
MCPLRNCLGPCREAAQIVGRSDQTGHGEEHAASHSATASRNYTAVLANATALYQRYTIFKKISAGSFRSTQAKTEVIMSNDLRTKPGTPLLQDGVPSCHTEKYGDSVEARAAELYRRGLSVRKVALEIGVSKSKAHRLRAKFCSTGTPPESVPLVHGGTAAQRSSSGDTPRESQIPTDEGAPTAGQDSRDSQTESGTPTAGSGTDTPSGTATPSRRRFIPLQVDPRTGLRYRLWPKDLPPLN